MDSVADIDRPMDIRVIDIAEPLEALAKERHDAALVLVTCAATPVGTAVVPLPASADELADSIERQLGDLVNAARERHHMVGRWSAHGPAVDWSPDASPVVRRRDQLEASGPGVTVAICTRERPEDLSRALDSLQQLKYSNLQLLVVDNAPVTSGTKEVTEAHPGVDYVVEPRPGASHARNKALEVARHQYLAFLDDDMGVDPHWVTALLVEVIDDPLVAATSSIVMPMELNTDAQVDFERYGGHTKGRGFVHHRFDKQYQKSIQSPYYPSPGFGASGTSLIDRAKLGDLRFDNSMGVGTRTRGGEDTLFFSEVMLEGHDVTYTPDAVSWHRHRQDRFALDEQVNGYGIGIGAFYAAILAHHPMRVFALAWTVVRLLTGQYPRATAHRQDNDNPLPIRRRLKWMARGPWAYLTERMAQARKG